MTLPVADGCDEGKRRVSAMPNRGEEWFVVLPDDDPLTASLFPSSCRRINHTSGRPWVVGQWAVSAAVQAIDDPMAVLLFGTFSIDQLGLQSALANMSSLEQVQHLLRSTAGSFHAVIRCAGTTIVRGTLAGTRRVFTARRGGRTIAANRADILAFVLGSGVDPVRCALELAIPDLPYGLAGGSMWMGVDAIPEYSQLRMTADGRSRHERWWTPPAASLGVRQGAAGVRAALENAITARLRPNLTVSCDLSGGWDSAAICHLAARVGSAPLITFTSTTGEPDDDDPQWADVAADGLELRRVIVTRADASLPFEGMLIAKPAIDAPFADVKDRGDLMALAARMLAVGSQLHVAGDGGDEVLQGGYAYLYDLVRCNPVRGLKHLKRHRALGRFSWLGLARHIRPVGSYHDWVRSHVTDLDRGCDIADALPFTAWGFASRLPSWVVPDSAREARRIALDVARSIEPASPCVGTHAAVSAITQAGRVLRVVSGFTSNLGLPLETPFLDDLVIEACLAVRMDERMEPACYKPLLASALADVLPPRLLLRTTKADYGSWVYAGLRQHRNDLVELTIDSELERMGIVNADALRANLLSLWSSPLIPRALSRTFGLERWLRDVKSHANPLATS